MTALTESEQRLVTRCVEGATWISDFEFVEQAVIEILRATGIPRATLAALADGSWAAMPKEPTRVVNAALASVEEEK